MITLTTDFGPSSPYVAQMKGVMLSLNPQVQLVDVTHAVPPQDVRAGALALAQSTPWFPEDSIHVAVVDPGVGTSRRIVYACIGDRHYVAPDNGLLSCLAKKTAPSTIVALTETAYWLQRVSSTFHGRDVMAPVAARLSLGLDPTLLGPRISQIVELDWPEAQRMANKIEGSVASVDSFGNLVTDISADQLSDVPRDQEKVRVTCGEHETFGIFKTYAEQPEMTLMALVGSGDQLELAIVGDSAKIMLGEGVGTPVTVNW